MNTKDWKMGYYPVPPRPKLNVLTALAELKTFNHHEAVVVLRDSLIRAGAIKCSCALMLQHKAEACDIHPDARLKTPFERMDFEREWDAKLGS